MKIEEKLGDGSMLVVEEAPTAFRTVLISRTVDGLCVWGQVFGRYPDEEWPGALGLEVAQSMRDMPSAFDRRSLWDVVTGAAVRP